MADQTSAKPAIDYDALYGVFNSSAERKAERDAKWVNKMAHKAYNLPIDDDVNIRSNSTTNNSGLTWKHLLAGGAGLSGLGVVGVLSAFLLQRPSPAPEPQPAPAVVEPVAVIKNFQVQFYDQHDKPFDYIPHRKAKGEAKP